MSVVLQRVRQDRYDCGKPRRYECGKPQVRIKPHQNVCKNYQLTMMLWAV